MTKTELGGWFGWIMICRGGYWIVRRKAKLMKTLRSFTEAGCWKGMLVVEVVGIGGVLQFFFFVKGGGGG